MKKITLITTLLTAILFSNAQTYDVIVHIDAAKLGQGGDFVRSLASEYAHGAANIPAIMNGQSTPDSIKTGPKTTILFSGNAQIEIPNEQYICIEELAKEKQEKSKKAAIDLKLKQQLREQREASRIAQMTEHEIRQERVDMALGALIPVMKWLSK